MHTGQPAVKTQAVTASCPKADEELVQVRMVLDLWIGKARFTFLQVVAFSWCVLIFSHAFLRFWDVSVVMQEFSLKSMDPKTQPGAGKTSLAAGDYHALGCNRG